MVWPADRTVELQMECPTVPMHSTNSSCLAVALDRAPQIQELQAEADEILQTAPIALECDGSDNAYSNLRYEAGEKTSQI